MPRFAANLSMMFTEVPFLDRFARARDVAGQHDRGRHPGGLRVLDRAGRPDLGGEATTAGIAHHDGVGTRRRQLVDERQRRRGQAECCARGVHVARVEAARTSAAVVATCQPRAR